MNTTGLFNSALQSCFRTPECNPSVAARQAVHLFERVYLTALFSRLVMRLFGRKVTLAKLHGYASSSHDAGIFTVEIDKIIGSEGKSGDFDVHFFPISRHTRQRWIRIAIARLKGYELPAVELLAIPAGYVVRDGHHRISVAAALGELFIDARVIDGGLSCLLLSNNSN